jgi:LacI family transcriptional regulator
LVHEDITLKNCNKTWYFYNHGIKSVKELSDVSDKTKKAVVELAQQLHYTPNSFAVNLRTKRIKNNRFDHTK